MRLRMPSRSNKALSILLSFVLVLSTLPAAALAEAAGDVEAIAEEQVTEVAPLDEALESAEVEVVPDESDPADQALADEAQPDAVPADGDPQQDAVPADDEAQPDALPADDDPQGEDEAAATEATEDEPALETASEDDEALATASTIIDSGSLAEGAFGWRYYSNDDALGMRYVLKLYATSSSSGPLSKAVMDSLVSLMKN